MDTLGVAEPGQAAAQTAIAKIVDDATDLAESNDTKALVAVVGALALQMEALNTRLADIDLTAISVTQWNQNNSGNATGTQGQCGSVSVHNNTAFNAEVDTANVADQIGDRHGS